MQMLLLARGYYYTAAVGGDNLCDAWSVTYKVCCAFAAREVMLVC
jgi:hypothetical protein